MSQSVIGALRVNLGLDSAKFESGVKRTKSPLKDMRKQFMAVSAAAGALGAAIGAMAMKGAAEIDRVAKASRRLGTSIEGFRALELAAGEAGVSMSNLANDVQTMDREIAAGTKAAMESLQSLGLAARDLEGLDADEKIALIADRVKELGLSSGEASAILRDLGVRNRAMVLAVLNGGDVFRQARDDVRDYGLAISDVDASSIETANDRIGRLGLIATYAGQRLALELVPALGRMAKAMTDSLREGGALRAVIDGLVDNLQRLATYVAVAVTGFGVRYVAALAAARLATLTLAGALTFLRGAIVRTGFGVLIVGAGETVYQFGRVTTAAGGIGEALKLMGNVAREVWQRTKMDAEALGFALSAVWMEVSIRWAQAWAWMGETWDWFRTKVGLEAKGLGEGLRASIFSMSAAQAELIEKANALGAGVYAPMESLAKLRAVLKGTADDGEGTAESLATVNDEIERTGSAAGKSSEKVEKLKDDFEETGRTGESVADRVSGAFGRMTDSIIGGAADAKSVVLSLIADLAKIGIKDFLQPMLTSGLSTMMASNLAPVSAPVPAARPSIPPRFAKGTDFAPGGMAWVGEEGPELLNIPRGSRVTPNHEIGKMGGASVSISVDARGSTNPAETEAAARRGAEAALTNVRPIVYDMRRRGEI